MRFILATFGLPVYTSSVDWQPLLVYGGERSEIHQFGRICQLAPPV